MMIYRQTRQTCQSQCDCPRQKLDEGRRQNLGDSHSPILRDVR